ncbi:MAG: nucleotidyltransferase family protein [Anditalea sp.]
MSRPKETALMILAAGGSTRLGQPKQELIFQGISLLNRAIEAGLKSQCRRTLVILGAFHERLIPKINTNQADILINPKWKEGMSSSLRTGMESLLEKDQPDQVIIMLCDQPFVDENILNQLISTQQETGKPIVACHYKDALGVPVLFNKKFFPQLMELKGGEGAKKILHHFPEEVASIPFPSGHIDIDTPADYKALIWTSQKQNSKNK